MTYWPRYAEMAVTDYGAQQHPMELGALLAILDAFQPESVIEIGTWSGGLTWVLTQLPEVETIVTVDQQLQPGWLTTNGPPKNLVHYIQGDSTLGRTRELVAARIPADGADVLVIDGGHDYNTVVHDWNNYQSLVNDRGLVVFHDTQGYPGRPDIQVPAVWNTIRRGYRSMELVASPGGPYGTGIIWKG